MIYAGFWRRFVAMILDFGVLIIPLCLLNVVLPYVGGVLVALLYYPIFESSSIQATPGKYWMRLKVLNENGQTLSFPRALARGLLKYVSSALLMVGYLIQLFTEKRQTLHDILTDAVVVEHHFVTAPDWVQTWIRQIKFVLRIDDMASASTGSASSNPDLKSEVLQQEVSESKGSTSDEAVKSIEKLYELYKAGALTEDEFQTKKSELLKQV